MTRRSMNTLLLASLCMGLLFAHSSTADDRRIGRNDESSASALSSPKGDRVALIIGNAAYKSAPLNNPVNDAQLLARTLRGLGFEVTERTNATRPQMRQAIDEFGEKLRNGMIAIFYYSGHGMQVNGNNYMVPVDASIHTEQDVEDDGVNIGRLLGKMEDIKDGLNIVILDACRDNPYKRSFKSDTQGLAFMNAPSGTIIAYATAPGKTAADGIGANSPYMESLSQTIVQPGLRIDDVFMRVGKDVERKTGGKQVPWKSDNFLGVFYLKPASGTGSAPIEMAGGPGPVSDQPGTNTSPQVSNDGSITDSITGLMWAAPAPDRDVTWDQANDYARNLRLGGYSDWRLPSRAELKGLWKTSDPHVNPALGVTERWAWSSEVEGSSAWLFAFSRGREYLLTRSGSGGNRVLAVRSRR